MPVSIRQEPYDAHTSKFVAHSLEDIEEDADEVPESRCVLRDREWRARLLSRDETASLAYILIMWVVNVTVYLSLVTWVGVTLWGSPDDSYISLLPVISLGLAENAAVQAVYLTFVTVSLADHIWFFWAWDVTRLRAAHLVPGGKSAEIIHNVFWGIRVAAVVLQHVGLLGVGSTSMLTNKNGHGIWVAFTIVCFLVQQIISLGQRFWFVVFYEPSAINLTFMLLQIACIITFGASLLCFELETCLGGDGAAPAFEYVLFSFPSITSAFRVLDRSIGGEFARALALTKGGGGSVYSRIAQHYPLR